MKKTENQLNHCTDCKIQIDNILRIASPFDAPLTNTRHDGKGSFITNGSGTDSYWEAGIGPSNDPNLVTNWIPAFVNKNSAWTNSIYSNANWVSYYSDTTQGISILKKARNCEPF